MPSLHHYQSLLQKHASAELKPVQEGVVDNYAVANQEHDKNLQDSRGTLNDLFTHAPLSSKQQTKEIKGLFNTTKHEVDTSNPLLKVAQLMLSHLPEDIRMLKLASPAYLQVAGLSFMDEVEKIASIANLGEFAHAPKKTKDKKQPKVPAVYGGDHEYR